MGVTPIVTGPIPRSKIPPSTRVTFGRGAPSSSLVPAVVTAHSSFSKSVQAPTISATDSIASSILSGLP